MSRYKKEKESSELSYLQSFGYRLKELLKNLKISQVKFAETIGVHKNTVWQWINGISFPEPLLLKKVITFFLENPKSKNFDVYKLLFPEIQRTTKTEFESVIDNLKTNYTKEMDKLSNANRKLNDELNYYRKQEGLRDDWEKELDELEKEKNELKQMKKYAQQLVNDLDHKKLIKQIIEEMNTKKVDLWYDKYKQSDESNYSQWRKNLIDSISTTTVELLLKRIEEIYPPK